MPALVLVLFLGGCDDKKSEFVKLVEIDRDSQVDVGVMELNSEPYTVKFQFQNVSGDDLEFERTEPTCGCLSVKMSGLFKKDGKQILAEGKVLKVDMKLDSIARGGLFEERMLVFFNQADRSEHFKLIVNGVSEGLSTEHGEFYQFRPHGKASPTKLTFGVASKDKIDFELLKVGSSSDALTLEVEGAEISESEWDESYGVHVSFVTIPVVAQENIGPCSGSFLVNGQLNGTDVDLEQRWQVIGGGGL